MQKLTSGTGVGGDPVYRELVRLLAQIVLRLRRQCDPRGAELAVQVTIAVLAEQITAAMGTRLVNSLLRGGADQVAAELEARACPPWCEVNHDGVTWSSVHSVSLADGGWGGAVVTVSQRVWSDGQRSAAEVRLYRDGACGPHAGPGVPVLDVFLPEEARELAARMPASHQATRIALEQAADVAAWTS
jgi:hypothetical protein